METVKSILSVVIPYALFKAFGLLGACAAIVAFYAAAIIYGLIFHKIPVTTTGETLHEVHPKD